MHFLLIFSATTVAGKQRLLIPWICLRAYIFLLFDPESKESRGGFFHKARR